MSDLTTAVSELFTAFGKSYEDGRASLYLNNLRMDVRCESCSVLACAQAVRERNTIPSYRNLLEMAEENQRSGAHNPHVVAPQLAPSTETFWRSEAIKLIVPQAEGDRDLASFVAAEMWWNGVPQGSVDFEMANYGGVWVESARTFTDGKDIKDLVQKAYERARWSHEHQGDLTGLPDRVRDLA